MKQKILDVIDAYVNEPDAGFIRAIPDPEVLADLIIDKLTDV